MFTMFITIYIVLITIGAVVTHKLLYAFPTALLWPGALYFAYVLVITEVMLRLTAALIPYGLL